VVPEQALPGARRVQLSLEAGISVECRRIMGLEEYEAPQRYLDASVAYKVSKYAEVFVNGTNLSNEYQAILPRVARPVRARQTSLNACSRLALRGQW